MRELQPTACGAVARRWIAALCAAAVVVSLQTARADDNAPKPRTASVTVRTSPDAEPQPAPRPTISTDKKPFKDKPATPMPFHVLNNKVLPPVMNFALSGFMGDAADLRVSGGYAAMMRDDYPTLRVSYIPAGVAGWSGAVWQNPANNWGTIDGGYNLSTAGKLKFWARGEKGGEVVSFTLGGNSANYPDSDTFSTGPIQLSDAWLEYTVDLAEVDLRYISVGFGFVVKRDENPYGATFFLDDVRYE